MNISYKKLWKLLIDRDMKKKDLQKAAGISNYVISKMIKRFDYEQHFEKNQAKRCL